MRRFELKVQKISAGNVLEPSYCYCWTTCHTETPTLPLIASKMCRAVSWIVMYFISHFVESEAALCNGLILGSPGLIRIQPTCRQWCCKEHLDKIASQSCWSHTLHI